MTTGKKTNRLLKMDFFKAKPSTHITSGEILKILREKNALSQNELAFKTHLTQATISSIENGNINLGIERAKTLAKALHVHPAVLVFPDLFEKAA